MDIIEFGNSIKKKYPEYAHVDSSLLGQKMLEKYPEYKDRVTTTQPSFFNELKQKLEGPSNPILGGLKSVTEALLPGGVPGLSMLGIKQPTEQGQALDNLFSAVSKMREPDVTAAIAEKIKSVPLAVGSNALAQIIPSNRAEAMLSGLGPEAGKAISKFGAEGAQFLEDTLPKWISGKTNVPLEVIKARMGTFKGAFSGTRGSDPFVKELQAPEALRTMITDLNNYIDTRKKNLGTIMGKTGEAVKSYLSDKGIISGGVESIDDIKNQATNLFVDSNGQYPPIYRKIVNYLKIKTPVGTDKIDSLGPGVASAIGQASRGWRYRDVVGQRAIRDVYEPLAKKAGFKNLEDAMRTIVHAENPSMVSINQLIDLKRFVDDQRNFSVNDVLGATAKKLTDKDEWSLGQLSNQIREKLNNLLGDVAQKVPQANAYLQASNNYHNIMNDRELLGKEFLNAKDPDKVLKSLFNTDKLGFQRIQKVFKTSGVLPKIQEDLRKAVISQQLPGTRTIPQTGFGTKLTGLLQPFNPLNSPEVMSGFGREINQELPQWLGLIKGGGDILGTGPNAILLRLIGQMKAQELNQ